MMVRGLIVDELIGGIFMYISKHFLILLREVFKFF